MIRRYFCPHHEEKSPSAVAYSNGYFSFCCGKHGPLTELGLDPGQRIEVTYVEDVAVSIAAIRRLPKRTIRGFDLHYTHNGFYLLWPDFSYYKFRLDNAPSGNKYRGPSGVKKAPYEVPGNAGSETVVLVEGEFNAMTLALLDLPVRIISPGGAGDFYSKGNEKLLTLVSAYSTVYIIVDDDAAGAQAAIEAKSRILVANKHCDVKIKLLKEDFNDTYVRQGREGLEIVAKSLGLPGGVPSV